MGNILAVWPPTGQVACQAYADWTDQNSPFLPHVPGSWSYVRADIDGNWCAPFLGPPFTWYGEEFPEPPGGAVMRAGSVLRDDVIWPDPP